MPTKRLSPLSETSSDIAEMPLKKTQRTHEENQERAYIAASRRADRDIEHRIRSALKASECRKKRTGRGLKITREAVLGDEQYESEDDDEVMRRFRPQTAAAGVSNPSMASSADRYAEVDALFAKHFPHVQLSSRWSSAAPAQHRYSYPPPLQIPPAFVPRYQQADVAATPDAPQSSPFLTPPTSYTLPAARGDKSRSMSPLELDGGSPTKRARTHSHSAAKPRIGLGIVDQPDDPGIAAGYLPNGHPAAHQFFQDAEDGLIYGPGRTPSTAMPPPPCDGSAAKAAGGAAWFGEDMGPAVGSAWHLRSLSLPSALESFQFPFETEPVTTTAAAAAATEMTTTIPPATAADSPALDPLAVDPAILATAADGGGMTGNATPPNEPWADWINLDEEVLPPLGIKV